MNTESITPRFEDTYNTGELLDLTIEDYFLSKKAFDLLVQIGYAPTF